MSSPDHYEVEYCIKKDMITSVVLLVPLMLEMPYEILFPGLSICSGIGAEGSLADQSRLYVYDVLWGANSLCWVPVLLAYYLVCSSVGKEGSSNHG
jgi:hypothetical protein